VRINDVEVAVNALADGFENKELMKNRKEKKVDFPTIVEWREKVLAPGDDKFGRQDFWEYYAEKFRICRLYGPARIAEIGVRYGYSAFAFLCASPAASYTGYDLIDGGHGGVRKDTFPRVRRLLADSFPDAKIELLHSDTRALDSLGGPYDFFHVDGDHSIHAVVHDIEIAFESLTPAGVILIDDYEYINGVKVATDRFISANRPRIEQFGSIESLRGEMLIRKR